MARKRGFAKFSAQKKKATADLLAAQEPDTPTPIAGPSQKKRKAVERVDTNASESGTVPVNDVFGKN